jgi:hypothetical protein
VILEEYWFLCTRFLIKSKTIRDVKSLSNNRKVSDGWKQCFSLAT